MEVSKTVKKYLALYVAEFQFRYNNRSNADIFGWAIKGMRRGLIFLFACVLAIAAAVVGIGYSSCEPPVINNSEQTYNNRASEKNCSTTYAAFESGLFQSWNFIHDWHDETIAIATIFIAIYTIVLGTSTAALVRETRDTAKRQLRAYVGVDRIYIESTNVDKANYEIPDPLPDGYVYRDLVRVKVKNFGGTPATVLTVIVNWQDMIPFGALLLNDFAYGDLGEDPEIIHRFNLDATDTETVKIRMDKVRTFRTAREKSCSLYIYGHIDYLDIFKCTWRRDFCYAYEPWAHEGDRFVSYGQHNGEMKIS